MRNKVKFEPVFVDAPPARPSGAPDYSTQLATLRSHPGKWAVINEGQASQMAHARTGLISRHPEYEFCTSVSGCPTGRAKLYGRLSVDED